MPAYTVHTIGTGSIRETWRVTSTTLLANKTIKKVLSGLMSAPDGMSYECVAEAAEGDIEDRTVTDIEVLPDMSQPSACEQHSGPMSIEDTIAPRVDPDPDVNWQNNAIQFPRLLAELDAAIGLSDRTRDLATVAASMDLTVEQVRELLNRANDTWDDIKRRTPAPEAK